MPRWIPRALLLGVTAIAGAVLVVALMYPTPGDNAGRWGVVAGALAVLAAVGSAWSAQRIVELEEDAQRPRVAVYLDASSRLHLIQLVVRNSGRSPARDVSLFWDGDSPSNHKGVPLSELLPAAILELQPGEAIFRLIDSSMRIFETKEPITYRGTVRYSDTAGTVRREPFVLDLEAHRGELVHTSEEPETMRRLQDLPQKLTDITRELQRANRWREERTPRRSPSTRTAEPTETDGND